MILADGVNKCFGINRFDNAGALCVHSPFYTIPAIFGQTAVSQQAPAVDIRDHDGNPIFGVSPTGEATIPNGAAYRSVLANGSSVVNVVQLDSGNNCIFGTTFGDSYNYAGNYWRVQASGGVDRFLVDLASNNVTLLGG